MANFVYSYKICLHEDRKDFGLGLCPVTLFLALAFADDAFNGSLIPEQLFEMKKSQSGTYRALEWKSTILETPVIRQSLKGQISQKRGMTYDAFLKQYHALLERAGFQLHSSPYAIRRGTANSIENIVSISRRMQVKTPI